MLNRKQIWGLLALTLMWGVNWPMMKLSLHETTPLMFRASTMMLGAGWLFFYVARKGERMWPARGEWSVIGLLALPNVLGWHTLSIFGVQELASGRAAILGFTMPIFTVLLGAAFFGERITPRVRLAVVCVALAIALLLWHEIARLRGSPAGIAWMLGAAFFWGLGTLMFRRSHAHPLAPGHHRLDAAAGQRGADRAGRCAGALAPAAEASRSSCGSAWPTAWCSTTASAS